MYTTLVDKHGNQSAMKQVKALAMLDSVATVDLI